MTDVISKVLERKILGVKDHLPDHLHFSRKAEEAFHCRLWLWKMDIEILSSFVLRGVLVPFVK